MTDMTMRPRREKHLRRHDADRKREGQSLVEFAFGVPLILLLLLGTVDLGQMFFDYVQLRNAVREGASYGSRNPLDEAGIRTIVRSHAGTADQGSAVTTLSDANIPISRSVGCCTVGTTATITVSATLVFTPVTTGFLDR